MVETCRCLVTAPAVAKQSQGACPPVVNQPKMDTADCFDLPAEWAGYSTNRDYRQEKPLRRPGLPCCGECVSCIHILCFCMGGRAMR